MLSLRIRRGKHLILKTPTGEEVKVEFDRPVQVYVSAPKSVRVRRGELPELPPESEAA